jgi:antitoxin MazE
MRVSRWGNSLGLRLPAAVVAALDLKEGDEIVVSIADARHFRVSRDGSRENALTKLRALKRPLPKGFKFERLEANER